MGCLRGALAPLPKPSPSPFKEEDTMESPREAKPLPWSNNQGRPRGAKPLIYMGCLRGASAPEGIKCGVFKRGVSPSSKIFPLSF